MRNKLGPALLGLICLLLSPRARAWAPEQPLPEAVWGHVEVKQGSSRIKGLSVDGADRVRVAIEPHDEGLRVVAQIKGLLHRAPYWTVVWEERTIGRIAPGQDSGKFSFDLPIQHENSEFVLRAVGPRGEIVSSTFSLRVPDAAKLLEKARAADLKRFLMFGSLGPTQSTYRQTGKQGVSQIALTAKFSFSHVFSPPRWDVGLSTYYTALPLSASPSDSAARCLGLNLRVGYLLPILSNPWQLSAAAGWYYVNMSVANNTFGIADASGPQLFPVLKRVLAGGDTVSAYAKFSPVARKISLLSVKSREITGGVTWVHVLESGRSLSFSFDYANLKLRIEPDEGNLSSIGVLVGYGF